MRKILTNDWLKIVVFVFAMGAFVARSDSTTEAVKGHEPRLKAVEDAVLAHTAAMREITAGVERTATANSRAVEAIQRLSDELNAHRLSDAADAARLQQALDEINRLRDR